MTDSMKLSSQRKRKKHVQIESEIVSVDERNSDGLEQKTEWQKMRVRARSANVTDKQLRNQRNAMAFNNSSLKLLFENCMK